MNWRARVGRHWRRLSSETGGSVAIQIGIMFIAIIGFVSLAAEIGLVLLKHREMQSTADSAAVSAATALTTGYPADYRVEARAVASASGFTDGVSDVRITINSPPTQGPSIGAANAVEVIVAQPQAVYLMKLFGRSTVDVGARAVAVMGSGSGCALQLTAGASIGVSITNGAVVNLVQCGLGVNATGSSALSMSGGAVVNAQAVTVVGRASITNGAVINPSSALKTLQSATADPYASVPLPAFSGCSNGSNKSYGHSNAGLQTLNPGIWCKGVSFTNDAKIKLNPGVYFVDRGNFNVGGAVVMTGAGVTIVLTSSTGSGYATVTIGNGANVTLSAPTSGATAGLVFYGDRRAPASNTIDLGGGALLNFTGAIYFPTQLVKFSNGISNPSGCTQLIAGTIQFTGGARFQNNCGGSGTHPIGGGASLLVE
jgi:Flp pilus assembly protein TadG